MPQDDELFVTREVDVLIVLVGRESPPPPVDQRMPSSCPWIMGGDLLYELRGCSGENACGWLSQLSCCDAAAMCTPLPSELVA